MYKRLFLAALLCVCGNATAAFSCKGKVQTIGLDPTAGTLIVNMGHGTHYLCKIHELYNGVDPLVCRSWYSMLLSAQASGREIEQAFNGTEEQTCATLGHWAVPNPFPYYVVLAQ